MELPKLEREDLRVLVFGGHLDAGGSGVVVSLGIDCRLLSLSVDVCAQDFCAH